MMHAHVLRCLLIAEVLLCGVPVVVEAAVRLELNMTAYRNPLNRLENGDYCDSSVSQCYHQFTFCLDSNTNSRDVNVCAYFSYSTGVFYNRYTISFTRDMRGVPNPLVYTFTNWPGGAHFKVQVRDERHGGYNNVDKLFYNISATPARARNAASWTSRLLIGTRGRYITTLNMEYRLYHIELDVCGSNPCQNNGYCIGGINSFRCQCYPGYNGTRCQYRNECVTNQCLNNGRCIDQINSFFCECRPGYSGSRCKITPESGDKAPFPLWAIILIAAGLPTVAGVTILWFCGSKRVRC